MNLRRIHQRMLMQHFRTRARKLPRMREPSDLAYRAALLGFTRRTQQEIRDELEPWLRGHTDNTRADGTSDQLRALFQRIRVRTSMLVAKDALPLARKFATSGLETNRTAMNEQVRSVIKIDPFLDNRGLKPVMDARIRANIELIKSIPVELADQVEEVVRPCVLSGVRFEETMKAVQERFDVSESRAQLIARDQTGKYNADLVRERQNQLGVNSYVWSTSKDSRVRDSHALLEGKKCSYDAPPVVDEKTGRTANPGEDYQCRCQALASVDDLLNALGIGEGDA